MSNFQIGNNIVLTVSANSDPCYRYAVDELTRLLGRLGCDAARLISLPGNACYIGMNTSESVSVQDIRDDGFLIRISESSVSVSAAVPKGVLNGVYELAEMFGFAFLKPGLDGEWAPEQAKSLAPGVSLKNPRFKHRGLFVSLSAVCSPEEHLMFHAKLKFNAIGGHGGKNASSELFRKLGIRKETGGHGLPECLERSRFTEQPELFRMFQPEDFGGKRTPDSNLCVTNPETRRIVVENFGKRLKEQGTDLYALHAWADDLPGGGWCMCPSCRSFSSEDQNMLGMKLLCRAADAAGSNVRIPVIAYHDTLFPGQQIPPEKRMFLLWAPRERCYAHRLDDPSCARNRIHWEALQQWMKCFEGIDDAHTFEYYQDQLLFTGMYPFIPETILGDMEAYEKIGIQSHMTLQVCSWDILPDYNELIFARAFWDRTLDSESFIRWISNLVAGSAAEPFAAFLRTCSDCFQKALAMCGHDFKMYLDYRWLPESDTSFARNIAAVYAESSNDLKQAAETFLAALPKSSSDRFKILAGQEAKRALFEAAELMSMHFQQAAMTCFAKAHIENDADAAREGCELLEKNITAEETAAKLAREAGYSDEWHYLSARSPWAIREASAKLEKYSFFTKI